MVLVGVITVWALVRRLVGGWVYPFAAAACFIVMPVVMNMAHEAKPHLPGAVLMLLAVLAGSRYVETGSRRWWMTTGALCGAAVGMVLSKRADFLDPPRDGAAAARPLARADRDHHLRRMHRRGRLPSLKPVHPDQSIHQPRSASLEFWKFQRDVSCAINRHRHRQRVKTHRGWHESAAGDLWRRRRGTARICAAKNRDATDPDEVRRRATGILLAIPALWVLGQCIVFATGKPAEFGRFAILPDTFLLIEAIVAIATFVRQPKLAAAFVAILWLTTALPGALYLRGFVHDAQVPTSRLALAEALSEVNASSRRTIDVPAEPGAL